MAVQEFTAPQAASTRSDCVTIIARSPGQALAESHRRGLREQGYAICGRVVPLPGRQLYDCNGITVTV